MFQALVLSERLFCLPVSDVIKLQLVEAGLVECLLDVVAQTVDGEREEDIAQLKTASDLMVLLLLGGRGPPLCWFQQGYTKSLIQLLHSSLQKLDYNNIHVCM